jgi:hypothetical protein
MSRAAFRRPPASGVTALLAVLALSACSAGPMGGTSDSVVGPSGVAAGGAASGPASLETQQACRQRVNAMYEIRNRGDIYAASSGVNTPQSANSYVGVPSHGLSDQFAYERSLAECERNSDSGAASVEAPTVSAPAVKGR